VGQQRRGALSEQAVALVLTVLEWQLLRSAVALAVVARLPVLELSELPELSQHLESGLIAHPTLITWVA
jgi:hypothetical protein